MGKKITKKSPKSPKWQKTPIGPWRHVAKPGEGGQRVVTSKNKIKMVTLDKNNLVKKQPAKKTTW